MVSDPEMAYASSELENELRQSEIISSLTQYVYDPENGTASSKIIPYAVIMSQDCDLLRDRDDRQKGIASLLNGVLLYEAEDADAGRMRNNLNTGLWRPIAANQSERYHFLSEVPAESDRENLGLSALLIDFRRYFTLSSTEIMWQVGGGTGAKRRCRLISPYREHLQNRAASYFQRVGLPFPHQS